MGYVPLIFMAVKGSISKPVVVAVCAGASYSAGWLGYFGGCKIRRLQWTRALMSRLVSKYPQVPSLMERRGAAGVALAALLPVPLAMATWTAGSFRVHLLPFAFAVPGIGCQQLVTSSVLMRLPKITIIVLLSGQSGSEHELLVQSEVKLATTTDATSW